MVPTGPRKNPLLPRTRFAIEVVGAQGELRARPPAMKQELRRLCPWRHEDGAHGVRPEGCVCQPERALWMRRNGRLHRAKRCKCRRGTGRVQDCVVPAQRSAPARGRSRDVVSRCIRCFRRAGSHPDAAPHVRENTFCGGSLCAYERPAWRSDRARSKTFAKGAGRVGCAPRCFGWHASCFPSSRTIANY